MLRRRFLQVISTVVILIVSSQAFVPIAAGDRLQNFPLRAETVNKDEVVAARVFVKGDVQGGYYRCCVINEASKFRKLSGMMSNPDDTDEAEIYVEGKRQHVDGFLRWCKKADKKIGLSQIVNVVKVVDEEPTGLYDSFYCKVKPDI